jgi:hypothetical protein
MQDLPRSSAMLAAVALCACDQLQVCKLACELAAVTAATICCIPHLPCHCPALKSKNHAALIPSLFYVREIRWTAKLVDLQISDVLHGYSTLCDVKVCTVNFKSAPVYANGYIRLLSLPKCPKLVLHIENLTLSLHFAVCVRERWSNSEVPLPDEAMPEQLIHAVTESRVQSTVMILLL